MLHTLVSWTLAHLFRRRRFLKGFFLPYISRVMKKPTFGFLTWSDTNQAVQLQKTAKGLKCRRDCTIYVAKTKVLHDQFRGHCKANLRLCFRICRKWFSHDAAHMGMSVILLK